MSAPVKPKLLVVELWGLGDLVIATPFLRAAAEKFSVTLLAKPYAAELQPRLWPNITVIPVNAPWTAFRGKYRLWQWPWMESLRLLRRLRGERFEHAVSGRWDPRDHLLMRLSGAKTQFGFPRLKSQHYLTHPLERPQPLAHRVEYWRVAGQALGLTVPTREEILPPNRPAQTTAFIHTGARLAARVWPLENFQQIAARLRQKNITVQIACDPEQLAWWQQRGENVACPRTVNELFAHIDRAGIFIGNCSGPGHLAAICGVPTFTLYGPSLPEWFAPLHPAAEMVEGRSCPYRPCSDYCRYEKPFCLGDLTAAEVWPRVEKFADRHLGARS
jgi:ADP-heptose:LPS heptosyltransferase